MSSSTHRPVLRHALRGGVLVAVAGSLVLAGTGVASAHVSAHSPDNPAKGGDAEIVFRVPAEESTAGTVKVQVNFSQTSPIGDASLRPVPGWTGAVATAKLPKPVNMGKLSVDQAVTSITWTAQPGTRINPGEFQEFAISVEGLPTNTDTMVMPAVQTYDNGDIVQWNQPTVAGKPEPDHPAPNIALAAAGSADAAAPVADATSGGSAAAPASPGDGTARWLGGIGVVLGALALGFGLGAYFRSRRPSAPDSASGGGASA
jgi:periplasmic copper chaperone A